MQRIKVKDLEPKQFAAMLHLSTAVRQNTLDPKLVELIKIRASQINACGFCLDMHVYDALALGEDEQRIHCLSGWRETPFYSEAEQAALALTEEMTYIHQKGVTDETYKRVAMHFDEHQMAQLVMIIATINTWNRISVATHTYPEKRVRAVSNN